MKGCLMKSVEKDGDAQGSWRIAKSLTCKILGSKENNVYSPACITEALRVMQIGAAGLTRAELDSLLGPLTQGGSVVEDYGLELPEHKVLNDYKAVSSVGLWFDLKARPSDSFLAECLQSGIEPEAADFSNPVAGDAVSAWIKESTEGLLSPSVQLSSNALSCIASAFYFKDAWFRKFDEEDTRRMVFHAKDGDVEADFMTKLSGANAGQRNGFLVFSLPLASDAKMVFALPDEGKALSDMLAIPELYEAFANPPRYDLLNNQTELFIPKFESESLFNGIAGSLQAAGFSTVALPDLFPMTGVPNTPADIVHGARISVDEIGVEAAAYTLITLTLGIPNLDPPKPKKVVLDRPFAYAVVSRTRLPLFIGIVNDPTAK